MKKIRLALFLAFSVYNFYNSIEAQTPTWEWAFSSLGVPWTSGAASAGCLSLCTDQNGDFYAAGYFSNDSITFGRGLIKKTVYNADHGLGTNSQYLHPTAFLVKFNADGDPFWAIAAKGWKEKSGSGYYYPFSDICSVVSAGNNIVVSGSFQGDTFQLAGTKIICTRPIAPGTNHYFLASFSANGTLSWLRHSEGRAPVSYAPNISLDAQNNILFQGSLPQSTDTLSFLNLNIINPYYIPLGNPTGPAFVVKFTPGGQPIWSKLNIGGPSPPATDNQGNIFIGSSFTNFDTIGNIILASNGQTDLSLVKMDPAGNVLWAKRIGGTMQDYCQLFATDHSGNIYVYAVSTSTSDFELNSSYIQNNGKDILIKLDNDGNLLWYKFIDGSTNSVSLHTAPYAMVADANDDIILYGEVRVHISFVDANVTLSCDGGSTHGCAFIAKFSSNGDHLWSDVATRDNSSTGTSGFSAVAVNNDILYLGGSYIPRATLGGLLLDNTYGGTATRDAFFAKLSGLPSGPTGIRSIENSNSYLAVNPNPTSDNLRVTLTGNPQEAIRIVTISDVLGRQISQLPYNGADINVHNLAPGVYILNAYDIDGRHIGAGRFIKQ